MVSGQSNLGLDDAAAIAPRATWAHRDLGESGLRVSSLSVWRVWGAVPISLNWSRVAWSMARRALLEPSGRRMRDTNDMTGQSTLLHGARRTTSPLTMNALTAIASAASGNPI